MGTSGSGWPITFSGNGVGGIGAIAHTKPSSGPTLTTPKATLAADASIGVATSGLNLFLGGINAFPFGGTLDLAGNTLTTTGLGNIGFVNLSITNSGNIQVLSPYLMLRDVALDGSGTLNMGGKNLVLGNLNFAAWTTGYVAKAISIGPGFLMAGGGSTLPIPVSSPISLAGALTVSNVQPIQLSGIVSGGFGVTKIGTGGLIINAASTYSGSTIVSGGTLAFGPSGSVANSALVRIDSTAMLDVTGQPASYTLAAGQNVQVDGSAVGNLTVPAGTMLSGSGTFGGTVTVNGGSLIPGKLDVPRTLTVGNLILNNALMTFELDAPTTVGGNANDLIAAGQISLTNVSTIKIVPIGTLTVGTPYTLFTYTGPTLPSSITNNLVVTSDTRYSFSFVDPASTPGSIQINVLGGRQGLVWQGGVSGAPTAWNINTTSNWNNGGVPDFFFNGDSVVFDDSATTNRTDLTGSIRPATVDMANNSLSYTIGGTGSLRTGALTNEGTAGLTFANNGDNTLSGAGLVLSGGTITFNQATNSHFTAILNSYGQGTLVKEGTNLLTFTGNSAATFNSPIQVNNGTLQAGSTNPFGTGIITITNSATLDVNGQVLDAPVFSVSGAGVGGAGVINNSGAQQTNALSRVTLNDDSTFGSSNRWDILPGTSSSFAGNGFKLTKSGPGDIWIGTTHDTGLGDVDIQQGKLVFSQVGTDIGDVSKTITVHSNASLAFALDITAGAKPASIQAGADIEAFASSNPTIGANSSYAGDITFASTGMVRLAYPAGLNLSGSVHGPSGIINADRGTLTLSGSNSYSGDLTVNLGQVNIASSNALPAGTTVTLNNTGIPSSDIVWLGLVGDTVTPSSVPLTMMSYYSPSGKLLPTLGGEGTWMGSINMVAVQTDPTAVPQINFSASSNLTIGGSVTQSGTPNVVLNMLGFPGTIRFQSALHFNGQMVMGSQGLGAMDLSQLYTTLELDAPNNSFTNMNFFRGKIIIGADNALPTACAMTIPAFRTDNDARNIIDLHGHTQTFANFPGAAGFAGSGAAPLWIGNDNTNADATLVFASSITNTWYAWLVDNINTNITTARKTSLSVTSGYLRLANLVWGNWAYGGPAGATNNSYTGPTTVTGGGLQVDAPLTNTSITVSGSGTLAGMGPFYGPITIGSGGTLSPGGTATFLTAIGRMTNTSSLTLQPGSRCYLEVNLTTKTNDAIVGMTSLTYGGTLVVTNVGALAFTNGTIVKLFDAASYVAGPVSILPAAPAPGLMWDTSSLAVDGTLHVVTSTSPVLTYPSRLPDGNVSFAINGGLGQGFTVRASTNVSLPFSTWTILQSGTITTVPYIFSDLTATNYPVRFYRISSP
jgi:autotransporter-associated beta strand protein